MSASGKCPKCEAPITRLVVSRVEAGTDLGGSTYAAMTLQCPACQTVLGAQLERIFDGLETQPRSAKEEQGNTSH